MKGADGATVTSVTFGGNAHAVASSGPTSVTVAGVGTFKFYANGDWSLTPVVNAALTNQSGSFTYQITDGDGDTSSATQAYTVENANSVPTAGTTTALVDDDGLSGGNAGGTGDATAGSPETVATGTLPHNFLADGAASSDPISFASMTSGTVGTEAVTYSWDGASNTLTASSVGRGAIFTVQVDNGTDNGNGAFKVTLLKPILHAVGGDENDAVVDLTYTVRDSNNDTATGTLQVTFDDDTPVATAQSVTIAEGTAAKSNVVLVLDRSGSMDYDGNPDPWTFETRISLMKAAISNLFASGNVNAVFIVSFADSGSVHAPQGGKWYTDLNSAMQAINGISADGGTNYDAALNTVISNYVAPPAGGGQTVVMFMSDGQPNSGDAIGNTDETNWINFLNTNGIAGSYAFGFGGLGNGDIGYLEPIAWKPGETTSTYDATDTSPSTNDIDDAADDAGVVVISDTTQLGGYLQGTVAASAQGNILTSGSTPASFGADGGRILSIVVDGVTYTWNGTNLIDPSNSATDIVGTTLTNIPAASGGKFSFNFVTGAWSYTAPTSITADITDQFQYTLLDNDGDTSSSSVSVKVENANEAPNTTAATATGLEDAASIAVALQGSDTDGTVSSYVIKSLPANGLLYADAGKTILLAVGDTVAATGGQATVYFAPAGDYSGQATFQFAAKDDDGVEDPSPATAAITVTASNDAPVITSNGGGDAAAVSVAENTTAVTTVTSTDVDSPSRTYSIFGGADASKFTINSTTGVLSFVSAPNYESPIDAGGNNVYDVIVQVSDGTLTDLQSIAVTVTNANESPTLASGLTVIANTANAFTVPDDAFLRYATDPDGNTLTVSSTSVVSGSLTTASHSGTTVTIDDNGTANGTLNVVVSDGSLSGNANVAFTQDTTGSIDGTSGNDIIVAVATTPTSQISTVTFAATYDVGDKVSVTINGNVFTHTVTIGTRTAEAVYDALKTSLAGGNGATLNSYLAANGFTTLVDTLGAGNVMTLTGAQAFTVVAATDNSNDTGLTTYRIDYSASNSFDNNDVLRVTINGVNYQSDGSNAGSDAGDYFDDARGSLIAALTAAGFSVTNDSNSQDRFDVLLPTSFGAPTAVQIVDGTSSSASVGVQGSASAPTNQTNPAVATTQTASDGGKTLNGLAGHDYLIGSSADDILNGGDGNDILTGGDGDDILWGGLGNDTLTGGTGEDTFRFAETGSANADMIADFVAGEDTIDLSDLLNSALIDSSNVGNYVRIDNTGTDSLLQVNIAGSGNNWVDVATLAGHTTVGTVIDLKIDDEHHVVQIPTI